MHVLCLWLSLAVSAVQRCDANACREKDEVIDHLQVRLRRAHQRAADTEAQSAQGQLEEQTAILQKACERVEQLENANSQLQACSLTLLTCSSLHDGSCWSYCIQSTVQALLVWPANRQ